MATKQQQAALDPLVNEALMQYQAEVDRLQAQLAAQQAVIDAARALRDCALRQHGDCEHTQAVADALDKAQAVQPEGEPR